MRKTAILILELVNYGMRQATAFTHFLQFLVQWGPKPRPEWHDHYLDQHWQWSRTNSSLWIERGVFSRMFLKLDGRVLEICCGDGFNTKHFYSTAARSITAIDFDKDAIPHARRYNAAPNVTYVQHDIRDGLPPGPFDNIVWDAAIAHFTETEIEKLLEELTALLGQSGIVSGYTLAKSVDGRKIDQQKHEFSGVEDLRRFFTPHFRHVSVWETIHPARHNLYFAASQSPLKFITAHE